MNATHIKQGFGYWDTTSYPAGGDFRRAPIDLPIVEFHRTITGCGPRWNGWLEVTIERDGQKRRAVVQPESCNVAEVA